MGVRPLELSGIKKKNTLRMRLSELKFLFLGSFGVTYKKNRII